MDERYYSYGHVSFQVDIKTFMYYKENRDYFLYIQRAMMYKMFALFIIYIVMLCYVVNTNCAAGNSFITYQDEEGIKGYD